MTDRFKLNKGSPLESLALGIFEAVLSVELHAADGPSGGRITNQRIDSSGEKARRVSLRQKACECM